MGIRRGLLSPVPVCVWRYCDMDTLRLVPLQSDWVPGPIAIRFTLEAHSADIPTC